VILGDRGLLGCSILLFALTTGAFNAFMNFQQSAFRAAVLAVAFFLAPAILMLAGMDIRRGGFNWRRGTSVIASAFTFAEIMIVAHDLISLTPFRHH
jgi:hypothetical protein